MIIIRIFAQNIKLIIMALEIKSTPVLKGDSADRFLKKAEKVEKAPKKDFSKQVDIARKILRK